MQSNDELLYVCNECHEMHEDETSSCEICGFESIRIVPKIELIN